MATETTAYAQPSTAVDPDSPTPRAKLLIMGGLAASSLLVWAGIIAGVLALLG
jgi:hypothetical protein